MSSKVCISNPKATICAAAYPMKLTIISTVLNFSTLGP
jgi:hypothetical protein